MIEKPTTLSKEKLVAPNHISDEKSSGTNAVEDQLKLRIKLLIDEYEKQITQYQLREEKLEKRIAEQDKKIQNLNVIIKTKKEEIKANKKFQEELIRESKLSDERVNLLLIKVFGSSSEKMKKLAKNSKQVLNEVEQIEKEKKTARKYTRTKAKNDSVNLDAYEQKHIYAETPTCCHKCGGDVSIVGGEYIKRTLVYVPAKYYVKNVHYNKCACKCCTDEDGNQLVTSAIGKDLIKNSYASASLVSSIIVGKYYFSLPLYRQEQLFRAIGLELSRSTMSKWAISLTLEYLDVIYEHMHKEIMNNNILFCDETSLRVLGDSTRKLSYVFALSSKGDKKITLYYYGDKGSRSHENFLGLVKDYEGYLQTDGYAIYSADKNDFIPVYCFAHLRRKHVEVDAAANVKSKNKSNDTSQYFKQLTDILSKDKDLKINLYEEYELKEGVELGINELSLIHLNTIFKCEEIMKLKNYSTDEKYRIKQEVVKPIIDNYFSIVETYESKVPPKSLLHKAFSYAINKKDGLYNYLLHGDLECSNNQSERKVKVFVIGRKNWLFSVSTDGAEVSSKLYTIIQTAVANNINVYEYIKYLLEVLPNWTSSMDIEKLMPWNPDIKALMEL